MFERRLKWVYAAAVLGLAVVLAKLVYLQVFQIALEDPDRVLHPPAPWTRVTPWRGPICDRNGVILAGDRPYLDLTIEYDDLCYPKFWLEAVSEATGIDKDALMETRREIRDRILRIRQSIRQRHGRVPYRIYEETVPQTLATGISLEAAAIVEGNPEAFPGIAVRKSFRRDRPYEPLARHVIGYLGRAERPAPGEIPDDVTISAGDRIGRTGIEKAFDRVLRGVPGAYRVEEPSPGKTLRADPLLGGVAAGARAEADKRIGAPERITPFPARPGSSVWLSLDRRAQAEAERALSGLEGAVVVMDVTTGDVIVLASAPSDEELNRAIQGRVPSGSVMKPIVALAAAAAGDVDPGTIVQCSGVLRVGGRNFHCHNHGAMTMSPAITHSCNIYFWQIGRKTGPGNIVALARDLGWGEKTGIDLPYEASGSVPSVERVSARDWYPGNTMNLSIGQGALRVTPLQVAVSMAAIANGGNVLKPRLVTRLDPMPEHEDPPDLTPRVVRAVPFPESALKAVREGMRGTVTHGTADDVPGLRELEVAAKTGTAETGDPNLNHAWLAGYAPYDKPRFAFAVVVFNIPATGADAAGPVAVEVLEAVFANVPPPANASATSP